MESMLRNGSLDGLVNGVVKICRRGWIGKRG